MRLAYLFVFLASLVFNALALETVIFKYDSQGNYIREEVSGGCECENYTKYFPDY
jgi:hypothetical protein